MDFTTLLTVTRTAAVKAGFSPTAVGTPSPTRPPGPTTAPTAPASPSSRRTSTSETGPPATRQSGSPAIPGAPRIFASSTPPTMALQDGAGCQASHDQGGEGVRGGPGSGERTPGGVPRVKNIVDIYLHQPYLQDMKTTNKTETKPVKPDADRLEMMFPGSPPCTCYAVETYTRMVGKYQVRYCAECCRHKGAAQQ